MHKQLWVLLSGRVITNFADSLYMIATIWYIRTNTGSPFLIGLTEAVAMLPILLQFLYGPLIDRFNKKIILFVAEVIQAVMLLIISCLYSIHGLEIPLLIVLMLFAFLCAEVTYPIESTLIEQFAEKEQLTKINAIFSFSYTTLDLLSNGIAGLFILFLGVGGVYISDSVLLVLSALLFLLFLRLPKKLNKKVKLTETAFFKEYKRELLEGVQSIKERQTLLLIMVGVIVVNLTATMGLALLPFVSHQASQYGFWLTAMAVGTLLGSLVANKLAHYPLNKILPFLSFLSGMAWMGAFIINGFPVLSFVLFGIAWMGIGVLGIYVQTLIQVNLPEEMLGRGFTLLSSFLGAISPIGYLLGGVIGQFESVNSVLLFASSGYFLFGLYFLLHPKLNRLAKPLTVQISEH